MKSKEAGNVRFKCPEHSEKPNPNWAKKSLDSFVSTFVKIGFAAINPETKKPAKEHMWAEITGHNGKHLIGRLDNYPIFEMELTRNDTVHIHREEIERVLNSSTKMEEFPPN
jgi:hypothetical protein